MKDLRESLTRSWDPVSWASRDQREGQEGFQGQVRRWIISL